MNTAAQGTMANWIMMAVFLFVIFFLWTSGRNQKKQEAERQAQIAALQKGDSVILPGGIVGTVAGFKDKSLEVKIAENVKITVLKSGIVGVLPKGTLTKQGGAK